MTHQVWIFTKPLIFSTLKNILVGKNIQFIIPYVHASTLCESPRDTVKTKQSGNCFNSEGSRTVQELQDVLLCSWTRSFLSTQPCRATLWAVSLFHPGPLFPYLQHRPSHYHNPPRPPLNCPHPRRLMCSPLSGQ